MGEEIILVVDDNRQIADFMATRMLPELGYKALVAYDGATALKIVKSRQLSLILLDLQLPDTNGLDLLRRLEKEGYNIPTILATAYGSEKVAADAFRLGVHDYLIKPVEPDILNGAITRALSESRLLRYKATLMDQLKEQVAWLAELSRVGQSVTSTLELDEVLRRIVEAGVRLTRAEEGFLALIDEKSGQLYLRAIKNLDQDECKTLRLPVTDPLVSRVLTQKKPLRVNSLPGDMPIKVSTGFLVNNLLHVPILSKGRPLGVLTVDNRTSLRPFKQMDEIVLMSMADYAAVALENAGLYHKAQLEISERIRIEMALRESEARYALAVRGSNEGLWDWDLKTNTMYYAPRWLAMLGCEEGEVQNIPQAWFNRIHPEDVEQAKLDILAHVRGTTSHFENEHRVQHKNGTYRWMLTRGLAYRDENGNAIRMAGSMTDINDRKFAEQKLLHDALHDALTDLPNRALFMDRLSYCVERAKRANEYLFAVLYLDLDRFKDINDSLGHMTGDRLLIETAKLLQRTLRATDTVARLGGDEFVILLDDIHDISDATRIADRIQIELANSLRLTDQDIYVSTSIGIVISATGYNRAEDVLRDADIAMYRAKAMGKARYEIFDATMRDRILERLSIEIDLRQSIEKGELIIHYQPIVSLKASRLAGFEALVRWRHPKRGLLFPADFISLAEDTGLIIPLDRWVLREACRQMKEWQDLYPCDPPLKISVNLSGKQVAQPDLVERVQSILAETGLHPECLKLEITESALIANINQAVDLFSRLQILGVQIEIDDFGVGYSSLSYLSNLPINALKVDQSFISMLAKKGSHLKIVQAIVMLAHGLGMSVVAEGVETSDQLIQLQELGCENAQGCFMASAVASERINELLKGVKEGENILQNQFFNHPQIPENLNTP
jgi:diguanylate cyclase (GGDEF)-like protein/PAS domain S-box-containing protein